MRPTATSFAKWLWGTPGREPTSRFMEDEKDSKMGAGAEGATNSAISGSAGSRIPPGAAGLGPGADAGHLSGAEAIFMQVDTRCREVAPKSEATTEKWNHCGYRYWISLRSAWLRVGEEEAARVPASFEDDGPLQLQADSTVPIRELSEGEVEDLEDCLDAVQRPFPKLRKSVPLMQAVQCAESLWDTDD